MNPTDRGRLGDRRRWDLFTVDELKTMKLYMADGPYNEIKERLVAEINAVLKEGRALSQAEHERWNAHDYPGTRQLCCLCDQPTERCEDDTLVVGDVGPLCPDCWES
jgi:hypothetical protein